MKIEDEKRAFGRKTVRHRGLSWHFRSDFRGWRENRGRKKRKRETHHATAFGGVPAGESCRYRRAAVDRAFRDVSIFEVAFRKRARAQTIPGSRRRGGGRSLDGTTRASRNFRKENARFSGVGRYYRRRRGSGGLESRRLRKRSRSRNSTPRRNVVGRFTPFDPRIRVFRLVSICSIRVERSLIRPGLWYLRTTTERRRDRNNRASAFASRKETRRYFEGKEKTEMKKREKNTRNAVLLSARRGEKSRGISAIN